MKRKIYLLINVVVFIVTIYLANLMARETSTPIGATIGFTLLLLLVEVAISLISTIIGAISNLIDLNKISSPFDLITPPFGLITLRFKKIYYSDLGYFWCYKKGNYITIYEQKLFALIKISKVDYYGDIESLRNRIKREIESIYEDKLRDKNISDKFKNWDGYIDKKSERDDKLEKLGIK
jgi:hypothetical protein